MSGINVCQVIQVDQQTCFLHILMPFNAFFAGFSYIEIRSMDKKKVNYLFFQENLQTFLPYEIYATLVAAYAYSFSVCHVSNNDSLMADVDTFLLDEKSSRDGQFKELFLLKMQLNNGSKLDFVAIYRECLEEVQDIVENDKRIAKNDQFKHEVESAREFSVLMLYLSSEDCTEKFQQVTVFGETMNVLKKMEKIVSDSFTSRKFLKNAFLYEIGNVFSSVTHLLKLAMEMIETVISKDSTTDENLAHFALNRVVLLFEENSKWKDVSEIFSVISQAVSKYPALTTELLVDIGNIRTPLLVRILEEFRKKQNAVPADIAKYKEFMDKFVNHTVVPGVSFSTIEEMLNIQDRYKKNVSKIEHTAPLNTKIDILLDFEKSDLIFHNCYSANPKRMDLELDGVKKMALAVEFHLQPSVSFSKLTENVIDTSFKVCYWTLREDMEKFTQNVSAVMKLYRFFMTRVKSVWRKNWFQTKSIFWQEGECGGLLIGSEGDFTSILENLNALSVVPDYKLKYIIHKIQPDIFTDVSEDNAVLKSLERKWNDGLFSVYETMQNQLDKAYANNRQKKQRVVDKLNKNPTLNSALEIAVQHFSEGSDLDKLRQLAFFLSKTSNECALPLMSLTNGPEKAFETYQLRQIPLLLSAENGLTANRLIIHFIKEKYVLFVTKFSKILTRNIKKIQTATAKNMEEEMQNYVGYGANFSPYTIVNRCNKTKLEVTSVEWVNRLSSHLLSLASRLFYIDEARFRENILQWMFEKYCDWVVVPSESTVLFHASFDFSDSEDARTDQLVGLLWFCIFVQICHTDILEEHTSEDELENISTEILNVFTDCIGGFYVLTIEKIQSDMTSFVHSKEYSSVALDLYCSIKSNSQKATDFVENDLYDSFLRFLKKNSKNLLVDIDLFLNVYSPEQFKEVFNVQIKTYVHRISKKLENSVLFKNESFTCIDRFSTVLNLDSLKDIDRNFFDGFTYVDFTIDVSEFFIVNKPSVLLEEKAALVDSSQKHLLEEEISQASVSKEALLQSVSEKPEELRNITSPSMQKQTVKMFYKAATTTNLLQPTILTHQRQATRVWIYRMLEETREVEKTQSLSLSSDFHEGEIQKKEKNENLSLGELVERLNEIKLSTNLNVSEIKINDDFFAQLKKKPLDIFNYLKLETSKDTDLLRHRVWLTLKNTWNQISFFHDNNLDQFRSCQERFLESLFYLAEVLIRTVSSDTRTSSKSYVENFCEKVTAFRNCQNVRQIKDLTSKLLSLSQFFNMPQKNDSEDLEVAEDRNRDLLRTLSKITTKSNGFQQELGLFRNQSESFVDQLLVCQQKLKDYKQFVQVLFLDLTRAYSNHESLLKEISLFFKNKNDIDAFITLVQGLWHKQTFEEIRDFNEAVNFPDSIKSKLEDIFDLSPPENIIKLFVCIPAFIEALKRMLADVSIRVQDLTHHLKEFCHKFSINKLFSIPNYEQMQFHFDTLINIFRPAKHVDKPVSIAENVAKSLHGGRKQTEDCGGRNQDKLVQADRENLEKNATLNTQNDQLKCVYGDLRETRDKLRKTQVESTHSSVFVSREKFFDRHLNLVLEKYEPGSQEDLFEQGCFGEEM